MYSLGHNILEVILNQLYMDTHIENFLLNRPPIILDVNHVLRHEVCRAKRVFVVMAGVALRCVLLLNYHKILALKRWLVQGF
jgi:hypothetical protein